MERHQSKEKKAVNKTSADISHIQAISGVSSPKNITSASIITREKKAQKTLNAFLQNYYNKKGQSIIIHNENFNITSKYQALREISSMIAN